jgi:hypothetical protein
MFTSFPTNMDDAAVVAGLQATRKIIEDNSSQIVVKYMAGIPRLIRELSTNLNNASDSAKNEAKDDIEYLNKAVVDIEQLFSKGMAANG